MKYEKKAGYTGDIAEEEVLGQVTPEQRKLEKNFERYSGEFFPIEEAMDLVRPKDCQPFKDPTNPREKPFPRDVHDVVAERLGLKNRRQLRYFTAAGKSNLDRNGVDAFYELDLGEGKNVRATIDITKREDVEEKYKSDVAFRWPNEGISSTGKEDAPLWNAKVFEVSQGVGDTLLSEARVRGYEEIPNLSDEDLKDSEATAAKERHDRMVRLLNKKPQNKKPVKAK